MGEKLGSKWAKFLSENCSSVKLNSPKFAHLLIRENFFHKSIVLAKINSANLYKLIIHSRKI